MRKIWGIARYTFIEILRNRIWYVLVLFSGILILSALLLGDMAGELRKRVITDVGLATIEMIALLSTVFAAVTLVLEEMESRTLYLILTRPVARLSFILGRFAGLVAIMSCAYVLMALAHTALLTLIHAPVDQHYFLSLFYSWQKIVVITAVGLMFSLFSTSTAAAATFTFFFWVMGHLSTEILFLAKRTSKPLVIILCNMFYYVFPNFQTMNIRDVLPEFYSSGWLWSAAGYGFLYTATCLLLSALLFRKKEF
jgi:ABC-type transport system involved in multi-copper enzyme maturation permease subunit